MLGALTMRRAALGMFLAQGLGCGGCVKDDPPSPGSQVVRPPVNMKAIDKRLSQFSTIDGSGTGTETDASSD